MNNTSLMIKRSEETLIISGCEHNGKIIPVTAKPEEIICSLIGWAEKSRLNLCNGNFKLKIDDSVTIMPEDLKKIRQHYPRFNTKGTYPVGAFIGCCELAST